MATYTIHFQQYPTPPGPSSGIQQLLSRLTNQDVIVLRGNPNGFERDIQAIKDAGIAVANQTDPARNFS